MMKKIAPNQKLSRGEISENGGPPRIRFALFTDFA